VYPLLLSWRLWRDSCRFSLLQGVWASVTKYLTSEMKWPFVYRWSLLQSPTQHCCGRIPSFRKSTVRRPRRKRVQEEKNEGRRWCRATALPNYTVICNAKYQYLIPHFVWIQLHLVRRVISFRGVIIRVFLRKIYNCTIPPPFPPSPSIPSPPLPFPPSPPLPLLAGVRGSGISLAEKNGIRDARRWVLEHFGHKNQHRYEPGF